MNNLDNRITQRIDLGSVQTAGMYTYEILEYDTSDSTEIIFVGNYYNSGVRYYTFDITDIIRSRRYNYIKNVDDVDQNVNIVSHYAIRVTLDDDSTVTGTKIPVAHIYTYPNGTKSTTTSANTFFDISTSTKDEMSVLLQGYSRYSCGHALLPRYPLPDDAQAFDYDIDVPLGFVFESGTDVWQARIVFAFAGEDPSTDSICEYYFSHLSDITYTHLLFKNMSDFISSGQDVSGVTTDIIAYLYNYNKDNYTQIARLEACKSRYYLMWEDRYGSFQCQPFGDKGKFSESITNTETINYTDKRLKSNVVVQPKWTIHSNWIDEDMFPLYESLYVSPVLKLIDSKTMRTYDVIVNSEYVEKKFANEKSLLNITLEVEATQKQNIIY